MHPNGVLPRILAAFLCLAVASCGESSPEEGETITIPMAKLDIPKLTERKIPLDVLKTPGAVGPTAFAAALERDGFRVRTNKKIGYEYYGTINNIRNRVRVPDFEVVNVIATRQDKDGDRGIKWEVGAVFENGYLQSGNLTAEAWYRPVDNSDLRYIDTMPTNVPKDWADAVMKLYGLGELEGREFLDTTTGETRRARREDYGKLCLAPDGSPYTILDCKGGISIKYDSVYETAGNPPRVCWGGPCTLRLIYWDSGVYEYNLGVYSTLYNTYQDKFGKIETAK